MDQLLEQLEAPHRLAPLPVDEPERKLDLFDVLIIFLRRKWLILIYAIIGLLCGLYMLSRQPVLFGSNAVILPPHQGGGSSALAGQLGLLAGLGGGGGGGSEDLYIGLLHSRSVSEHMARRFNLMSVYHVPNAEIAGAILESRSNFQAGRDSLITITTFDESPKRAAALADGYVDELFRLNNTLAIGEASQRRRFFEQQLALEKDKLADAEVALKNTQLKTGILQVNAQTQAILGQLASVQANITNHEVQLAALSSSATNENPEVVRLKQELVGLRAQLQTLEKGTGGSGTPFTAAQMPAAGLEYIHKERDVQYHQTLYDLLARQLEAARIDEAKASPTIQVVDHAEVSDVRASPHRGLYLGVGALFGFVIGCLRCVVLFLYDFADADPRLHGKFVALKRAARLRA
jgi:tyrosine-protein kinase Etk/Wzc